MLGIAASATDGQRLAKSIDTAFFDACLPNQRPYVDALRAFIAYTVRAYRRGYSLHALQFELQCLHPTAPSSTGEVDDEHEEDEDDDDDDDDDETERDGRSSVQRRPLQSDEIELRTVWITLVYKVLREIRFPQDEAAPMPPQAGLDKDDGDGAADAPDSVAARGSGSTLAPPDNFDVFVKSIVGAARAGYDLERIKLEQQYGSGAAGPAEQSKQQQQQQQERTPLESAILAQSTRMVVLTLEVADARRRDRPENER